MKTYMIRMGVSSRLNDEDLEDAIVKALSAAGIEAAIYDVLDAGNEQWTMHKLGKQFGGEKP